MRQLPVSYNCHMAQIWDQCLSSWSTLEPVLQGREAAGCRTAMRWPDSWRDTRTHLCLPRHHHKHTWPACVQRHLPSQQLSLPLPDRVHIEHVLVSCFWAPLPAAAFICQLCCGSVWNIFRQLVQVLQPNIPLLKQFIKFWRQSHLYSHKALLPHQFSTQPKTSAAFGGLHRQMPLSFALQLDINLHVTILSCL